MMLIPIVLAATLLSAPPSPSPERLVVEKCVWDRVRAKLGATPRIVGIDAQLSVANAAVAKCRKEIRRWAETSPAVQQAGDPLQDVEQAMTNIYVARAAQFAAGEMRPFHLTDAHAQD